MSFCDQLKRIQRDGDVSMCIGSHEAVRAKRDRGDECTVDDYGVERRTCRASRILLAEDDSEMRKLVIENLRPDGYVVFEANSGDQLLDFLADQILGLGHQPTIDLIVSDNRMPGFTGTEILEGVMGCVHRPPFILMSAFGGEAFKREALRLGAVAAFDKPFDLDDLRLAVRAALRPVAE